MSGAILPLPQYAFMEWCLVKSTGTNLPLPLPYYALQRVIHIFLYAHIYICVYKLKLFLI